MYNKTFFDLDIDCLKDIKVNLSAVERRTSTLTKRRTVKKENQAAWLLRSINFIDGDLGTKSSPPLILSIEFKTKDTP